MTTNERVIGVKIVFDGGDSVKEAEKLEESLKGVNNETEKLTDNAKELTGVEKEFDDLNKKVSKGGMTLKEMSKAMKEYRDIALKSGETSPIRQEAINMAAQLKDDIRGLGEEISRTKDGAANMQAALQLGGSVIAGYSAFQSVTAALGVENEDLQKQW
jgi:predicted  nucleic acid-binding Zn-ribbon protein